MTGEREIAAAPHTQAAIPPINADSAAAIGGGTKAASTEYRRFPKEAGDKLFTFTRFPKNQWKSTRASNAIVVRRLAVSVCEEFRRWITSQAALSSTETAAMLFWALLASGQITLRKADGWRSVDESHLIKRLTSPRDRVTLSCGNA